MTRTVQRIRLPIRRSAKAVGDRPALRQGNVYLSDSHRAQILSGRTETLIRISDRMTSCKARQYPFSQGRQTARLHGGNMHRNRIASGGECNYHIFLNSVEDIASIIRTAELTPANTRVICSQNEETLRKNLSKLPEGFGISKALDELKTISFYTSTCFEGQDIIDPNGRSFIVSNAQKDHTLLDIATTFFQICGRIRKSNYNDEIVYFYSTTRYTDVSLEEFERATYKTLAEAEEIARSLNGLPDRFKAKLIRQLPYMNEPYIQVAGNELKIDRNMANFDIVNYKVVNGIYPSNSGVGERRRAGYERRGLYRASKHTVLSQRRVSFDKLFETYCAIKDEPVGYSLVPDYRLEIIEGINPLVKNSYDILGRDEVRRMKYHQSNIRREIIKRMSRAKDYRIVELINETLPLQKAISVARIKSESQEIYDELGIPRKSKATDLNN